MFQSISVDEIFDLPEGHRDDVRKAQAPKTHPSYWLAQLRKAEWLELLKFVNVNAKKSLKKQVLAEITLQHFEFLVCESRADVWQIWGETHRLYRGLVIQFRHAESSRSCGIPEFVDLAKNEPLSLVNIAGRLFCKVK